MTVALNSTVNSPARLWITGMNRLGGPYFRDTTRPLRLLIREEIFA